MKRITALFVSLLCLAVMIPVCFAAPMRARAAVSDYSEQTVYQALLAMKSKYPEGMRFDNSTPYSEQKPYYWKAAGQYDVGCAAFAAILSDAVFGTSLPVQKFQDVRSARPGDVLRYNGGYGGHTVIVLQKRSDGIEVAEGNYNGKVHWGRIVSFSDLQNGKEYFLTRYPQQSSTGSGRGDTDGSGAISIEDVQMALIAYTNQVSGKSTGLSSAQLSRADADLNGRLGVEDVQLILIYYTRNVVSRQNIPWDRLLQ